MTDADRKQLLDQGHRARVLLDQQVLWELCEVLTAIANAEPTVFVPELPVDVVEMLDLLGAVLVDRDITLAELAREIRETNQQPRPPQNPRPTLEEMPW